MNHAGDSSFAGFPLPLSFAGGLGVQHDAQPPQGGAGRGPLAIVGAHPATRELAPYDDPAFEIWLFNEAPQKPEVYRRWDASFQLHRPEVYTSLENWVNRTHWAWLQQDHGDRRIYMIDADPRVPNSVRYPLEGVLSLVPYRYLRSSPAYALALAIYLGYQEIHLYGSELSSNTEYTYQAINYAFWIGFAHGRGIDLRLHCWQGEFDQPLYGYEGEPQIDRDFFEARAAEHESAWKSNDFTLEKIKTRVDQAMQKNRFDKTGELTIELELAAMAAGEAAGAAGEARRYSERTDPISRQEFERVAAQAQRDGDKRRQDMHHAGGKCEYVWNVWRQSSNPVALQQLRTFLQSKTEAAYHTGAKLGVFRENMLYLAEYDKRVTALGGERAVQALGANNG